MKIFLLSLLFALFSGVAFPDEQALDSLFKSLTVATVANHNVLVNSILSELDKENEQLAKTNTERLSNLTLSKHFNWGYVRVMIYSASRFGPFPARIGMLNIAIRLAENAKFQDLIAFAEQIKGNLYKDNNLFDSAMVSTLRARDLFEEMHNENELISEKHTIADLYYYAGNYDRAEQSYKEIMQKKGDLVAWENWRQVVITNDLGLIEKRRGNFEKAANIFLSSESCILNRPNHTLTFDDSSHLAYIYNQLAEILLAGGNFQKAESFCLKSLALEEQVHTPGALGQLFAIRAGIFYKSAKYDSALVYVKKAETFARSFHSLELDLSIYYLLYKINESLGDYKNAFLAQNKYDILKDSANNLRYQARYMDMLVQNNYERYTRSIEAGNRVRVLLLTGFVIIALLLSIISLFYYRTRRANKLLVKKILDLHVTTPLREVSAGVQKETGKTLLPVQAAESLVRGDHEDHPDKEPQVEPIVYQVNPYITHLPKESDFTGIQQETISELAEKIEYLMKEKKIYLNPGLSLDDIARDLETNRLYVSRAINSELYTNFISYVNEYRIKEAIRLITLGEHKVLSMEGIAHASGFNNRKSFSAAFLKFNGLNPTDFIKNYERYFKHDSLAAS